jgi:hypothetical protein
MEQAVVNDSIDDAAEIACHFFAMGEFIHIPEIFKKSKHYKSQDIVMNGFLTSLSEFGKSIQKLIYMHDFTNELFSKECYDFQIILNTTEK